MYYLILHQGTEKESFPNGLQWSQWSLNHKHQPSPAESEDCITSSAHLVGSLPTHSFDVLFRWWLWVPRELCWYLHFTCKCTALHRNEWEPQPWWHKHPLKFVHLLGKALMLNIVVFPLMLCWVMPDPSCASLLSCTVPLTPVHALPGYEGISEAQCVSEDMVSSGTDENVFFQTSAFDHCLNHIPSIYTDT